MINEFTIKATPKEITGLVETIIRFRMNPLKVENYEIIKKECLNPNKENYYVNFTDYSGNKKEEHILSLIHEGGKVHITPTFNLNELSMASSSDEDLEINWIREKPLVRYRRE